MKMLHTYLLFMLCSIANITAITPSEVKSLTGASGVLAGLCVGFGLQRAHPTTKQELCEIVAVPAVLVLAWVSIGRTRQPSYKIHTLRKLVDREKARMMEISKAPAGLQKVKDTLCLDHNIAKIEERQGKLLELINRKGVEQALRQDVTQLLDGTNNILTKHTKFMDLLMNDPAFAKQLAQYADRPDGIKTALTLYAATTGVGAVGLGLAQLLEIY